MNRRTLTPHNLMFAFFLILALGITASAITTTDHSWIKWHFSQLGERGGISAVLFNGTLMISALILALYSSSLTRTVMRHYRSHEYIDRIRNYHVLYYLIAIGLVGVGLFPRDTHLFLHDVFGHSIFVFFVALVIGAALIPNFLPRYLRIYSAIATVIIVTMWAIHSGFEGNIISMTQIEVFGAACIMIWLWVFTNHVSSS